MHVTERDWKIIELRRDGLLQAEIAESLGISKKTVIRVLQAAGMKGWTDRGRRKIGRLAAERQRPRKMQFNHRTPILPDDIDDAIDLGWR